MSTQTLAHAGAADSVTSLWPAPARVRLLDGQLRSRLAESLDYLGDYARANLGIEFAQLAEIRQRLQSRTVSPWMYCLFSKLTVELSKDAPGNVASLLDDIRAASSLDAAEGVVPFGDRHPASWWNQIQVLVDTDRKRPLRMQAPDAGAFEACKCDVDAGLSLLRQTDAEFYAEVALLLRTIVLGSSAPGTDGFNGVSTFFYWGGTVLDVVLKRSPIDIIDLLVHESSHNLLFALSSRAALTKDSGKERYFSPVRTDERPMDGIFHACFVTSRVHLCLDRLIRSGQLDAKQLEEARGSLAYNESAARQSLDFLKQQAKLTATGEKVLAELDDYWARVDRA
jgi:hypothetical protein